jgi:hypothetical protein
VSRPHFLPKSAWLGIQVGEWPLFAFTDEDQAQRWAAEAPEPIGAQRARRIWLVEIPDDTTVYRVDPVPATTALTEVTS